MLERLTSIKYQKVQFLMSGLFQKTPKRGTHENSIGNERPDNNNVSPTNTKTGVDLLHHVSKQRPNLSEANLLSRPQVPKTDYSSIHSDRFSRLQAETSESDLEAKTSSKRIPINIPTYSADLPESESQLENKVFGPLGKIDNVKASAFVPVPRSPQPSPHPPVNLTRPLIPEKVEVSSRATQDPSPLSPQPTTATVHEQLAEERFMKDELLAENIGLRAYIQHLESDDRREVDVLKAQVKELREINEECRGSLAVAVEGLKQAKELETAHKGLLEEKGRLEGELRKEFLAEIERIQTAHQEEIQTLQAKIPSEEEFFSMQQLMEENSILKEKLSEMSAHSHKHTLLQQTADHSNSASALGKIRFDQQPSARGREEESLSQNKFATTLQKLRKQIADLLRAIDGKSALEGQQTSPGLAITTVADILEFECDSMLEEAKQGLQLMRSLSKTSQQRIERLERELAEQKQLSAAIEAQLRLETEQHQTLRREVETENQHRIVDNQPTQAAEDLERLRKEKEDNDEKENASKNIREYLEQKMTSERLEKMVYREFVEKLKSWVAPEHSKMIEEILSITRQLGSYHKIKSQGLEDILDVSQSKEEEIQATKDYLESRLEQALSKSALNDSSSRNLEILKTQDKPIRSLRPSFNRQAVDSPSVRSSSFFAATDDYHGSERQHIGASPRPTPLQQHSSQRKLGSGSEGESSLSMIRKELPGSFLSSVAPKIAPSPSRSPLDKMMEDHALNFGHLRDKLKDIKAKLNS